MPFDHQFLFWWESPHADTRLAAVGDTRRALRLFASGVEARQCPSHVAFRAKRASRRAAAVLADPRGKNTIASTPPTVRRQGEPMLAWRCE
jgi:hypothetical protein